MKNLKDRFYNIINLLKKAIEKFPLAIISIIVLTVIYAINLDNDFITSKTLGNMTLFVSLFASSAFLIETIVKGKIQNKVPYYVLSALWSITLTCLANYEKSFLGMQNDIFLFRLARLVVCYIISIIVLGIYFNYKNSGKTFEEYVTKTVIALFKASFVYGILAIGIAIVMAIFVFLILSGTGYLLIARTEILLFGVYYIPTIIYAFYAQDEEVGKFAKIVIKYVLGTLLISAFAIIYMYIIKIIVLRKVPSNQIFRILSALFIGGLPIWTMGQYLKENGYYDKILSKLPILFIPFIFLQIYAIGVRIIANGITEPRYLCLMLILFEIIYIAMYLKNKEKIGNILNVFVILTIISTIVPFVNMFKISITSQVNNLKIYKQKTEYTSEEKSKIYGAYAYLNYSPEGKKYVENILTTEDKKFIRDNFGSDSYGASSFDGTIYVSSSSEFLNIEGYKRLYEINSSDYSYEEKSIDVFKNIKFDIQRGNNRININIENLVKDWINEGDDLEKNFENYDEMIIDENRKVIFDYVSIRYDDITKDIKSYSLSGYLLEK